MVKSETFEEDGQQEEIRLIYLHTGNQNTRITPPPPPVFFGHLQPP